MMTCWDTKYIEWALFWSSDLYFETHRLRPKKETEVVSYKLLNVTLKSKVSCSKFVMAINFAFNAILCLITNLNCTTIQT